MKNPKLFREMSEPFESADAANKAVEAFFVDLGEIRKKHKLTNVYVIISSSYVAANNEDESEFMTSCMFGDSMRAEILTAWALGREQTQRQELIASVVKSVIKDARKQGHG